MFVNEELQNHLETSSVIKNRSLIVAEINLNMAENIAMIGNYRYRPSERFTLPLAQRSIYSSLINSYDFSDTGNFFTGATDADIVIDGGFSETNVPAVFKSKREKENLLFSLEDCFGRFRPRSGINKLRYFEGKYTHHTNSDMSLRPRYYMADKTDKFKYWTSYRTEASDLYTIDGIFTSSIVERGIANQTVEGRYYIDDAAPFIVYKDPIPTNKVVVKMQTNVGSIDLGPFASVDGSFEDPLFGESNQTTPQRWAIQYLQNNVWIDAIRFNEFSTRFNGLPIIGPDGYVEISYGLVVPEKYRQMFYKAGEVRSTAFLPESGVNGEAYLVKASPSDLGTYYVWFEGEFETFVPFYDWYLSEQDLTGVTGFATEMVEPITFVNPINGQEEYQEFKHISGLRVVVETMNKLDSTFDLIELSPRLVLDLSDKTTSFSITKPASDLGVSGMPVGQLLAGTGNISIFDYDQAFVKTNTNSVIAPYTKQNIQIKMYEVISNVNNYDYYVPIKTMYTEGFPEVNTLDRQVSIPMRDMYFYFESLTAPQLLLTNVSLSYAISTLLDSIGFSNYSFKRVDNENEAIIPFFFVPPDTSIAEVLNQLAISTQSTMFFDEYNNFIVMSKNYILPSEEDRPTDVFLYGSQDSEKVGAYKNAQTTNSIANIIDIGSQENKVYNDGSINYTTRYIQRSYNSIRQASLVDRDKTWIYKPVLLWEVAGTEATKTVNDQANNQSNYVLSAIPLNSDLSDAVPTVSSNAVINNVMDLGEGVYWISRYNGYFYANGEVIKYDAVQYSIPGLTAADGVDQGNLVWITSAQQYQRYFAKLPFNGKIYPTGLVRIYSEPNYEVIDGITRLKPGAVAKHGRGQFGTPVVYHNAGLSTHWSDNANIRGCNMKSEYLFSPTGLDRSFTLLTGEYTVVGTSITVPSTVNYVVGATVRLQSPPGTVVSGTRSTTIVSITNSTTFVVANALNVFPQDSMFIEYTLNVSTGLAGANLPRRTANSAATQTTRNGIIKNFLSSAFIRESDVNNLYATQTGTIQSSALVVNGPALASDEKPLDFISYINKPLSDSYKHFGTRLRIIGRIKNDDVRVQSPTGSTTYYTIPKDNPQENVSIGGASGGVAVMVNPETNNGYFFELIALTENNIQDYQEQGGVYNVIFYKVLKDNSENAIPIRLWGGISQILVDDGNFTGQYRVAGEETPTVYDLAVEYETIGSTIKFYLYLNNRLVQVVTDSNPLPIINNMALFVRGSSRVMFENVYAIAGNYALNPSASLDLPANTAFTNNEVSISDSFRKYAMSGILQSTYLSGISPSDPPQYRLYFEEFGTIMREAAYLNVRYDKAYPALYAQLSPTFNRIKGYTVSGFFAGAYGAEFLIFNATDTAINLDESSGNYLRIQGITFTQESQTELTVDDYFSKRSDFSNPQYMDNTIVVSPIKESKDYFDIKTSRLTYGKKEFSLDTPYIQTQDDANELMSWMISKIMKPRLAIGVKIFSTPTIQLGDIVQINFKNVNNIDEVVSEDSRFVVYNIEYERSVEGPAMTLFLSEVA